MITSAKLPKIEGEYILSITVSHKILVKAIELCLAFMIRISVGIKHFL